MSTLTKPVVLDETMQTTNKLLAALVRDNAHASTYTLARIREIVASGIASQVFAIGDQVISTYTFDNTEYTCPWDIVAFKNVVLQDGETVPGMVIQMHYATPQFVKFDAPEPDNLRGTGGVKDDDIASRGYNRWSESGARAWLNSAAAAGAWWGTTFERNGVYVTRQTYDVAPSQLSSQAGFMSCLSSDFLNIVKPVQVSTRCNDVTDGGVTDTTYDTFFLPSNTELYTSAQAVEGTLFPYWKRRLGRSTVLPTETKWASNIIYALNAQTTARHVCRRSVSASHSTNVWGTSSPDGNVIRFGANSDLFYTPVCVIC